MALAPSTTTRGRLTLRGITPLLPLLALVGCLEPSPRGSLDLRLHGPAYPRWRCAKGPASGSTTSGSNSRGGSFRTQGRAAAGATVVLEPGGFTGTSDASGNLTLGDIPKGSYSMRITSPAHVPIPARTITISAGKKTVVDLTMSPCLAISGDFTRVGFNQKVTLTAFNKCGDSWKDASFTWTQVEGPDVRASVKTWTTGQLQFTTRKLKDVRPLPDEPQILSFSPDQAGQYVFRVVCRSSAGQLSEDQILVSSTNVTGGMNSVPPFTDNYFVSGKKGPWVWEIITWPDPWPRTLEVVTDRVARVRLTPTASFSQQKTVVVMEKTNGFQFKLVVGNWDQVNRDCGNSGCHPGLQKSWEATRHGTSWQKLLDGELAGARAPTVENCAYCHSMGYDRSNQAPNGGYDDIADGFNVSFPTRFEAGNYKKLPRKVKDVSNVFCLACHGPARVDPPNTEQPGRFAVGVCARCHDRKPEQDLVAQWRESGMSQTVKGDVNGPESKAECSGCHTAQGFYYTHFKLGRPPSPKTLGLNCCDNLAPITCQTCHSPMYATNKAQLFRHGWVKTKSGLDLKGIGSGALCVMCHNTDHDTGEAMTVTDRLAPHSPQANIGYGKAGFLPVAKGYPIPGGPACFKTAGDGCVTCHMNRGPAFGQPGHRQVGDHTFRMISSGGQANTQPCQACHPGMKSFDPMARHDYDGDAKLESVRDEVDGLMAQLKTRLSAEIAARGYQGCGTKKSSGAWVKKGFRLKLVVVDALGFDLGDCDRSGEVNQAETPFVFPVQDLPLHRAAYNFLLIAEDKSRGLHNLPFVVTLLQRTLHELTGGKGLPDWDPYEPHAGK